MKKKMYLSCYKKKPKLFLKKKHFTTYTGNQLVIKKIGMSQCENIFKKGEKLQLILVSE